MRKIFNEPGFWLMVFGVIIIALVLFAPNADCQELVKTPSVQYVVSVERQIEGWGVVIGQFETGKLTSKLVYHHYIRVGNNKPVKVLVTEHPPNLQTLIQSLNVFKREGGL